MLTNGKNHISYSEIKDWKSCSFRHKLKYIDQLSEFKQNQYTSFGTAIHEACESFLKTKTMDISIFETKLKEEWETGKELPDFSQKNFDDCLKDGISLLGEIPKWFEETFPNWEYVAAEREIYQPIYQKENSPNFKGFIDCIIKCDDKYWILDWKTTMMGWNLDKKKDPDIRLQLVLYKKYYSEISGIDLKDIKCGFILLKRKYKSKKCELFQVSIGEKPITEGKKTIDNMLTSMDKGIAVKNKFSCKYCEFYMTSYCK